MLDFNMLANLKLGAWLDKARIRNYSLIILMVNVMILVGLFATANGQLDALGRPIGIDFSQIWVAGLETLRGEAGMAFDTARHMRLLQAEFGVQDIVFIWAYPPFFLGLAAVLATLPYLLAFAVWQTSTLMVYLAVVLKIVRIREQLLPLIILPALAFPAVQVNLLHGQTGFLTAALMGFGFAILEKNPVLSGICLGLLSYKPQLGLVLPIILIAGGHWKTFFAAAITVLLLIAASFAMVDLQVWSAFIHNMGVLREIVLDNDGAGYGKLQSVFAAVRLLGGSNFAAYLVQGLVALMAIIALARVWRSGADKDLKKSAAITGTLLTTPYCFDYDMMVLAPAIAFSIRNGLVHGFAPYEKSVLAAAFLTPYLARPVATHFSLPVGCLSLLMLFVVTIHHVKVSKTERYSLNS